jgi:uncharacterized surface protein with fasciclin (FAS1) repeats
MSDRLNLIATMATQAKFSTFAKLMASTGANDVFKAPGEFTVFVPTNDAFAKIPRNMMSELLNEPGQTTLKTLLSYHVVPGKLMAANLAGSGTRTSCTGGELSFSDSNGLKVNGAPIQSRNIDASNGVIHAIDIVLAPTAKKSMVAKAAILATSVTGTAIPN